MGGRRIRKGKMKGNARVEESRIRPVCSLIGRRGSLVASPPLLPHLHNTPGLGLLEHRGTTTAVRLGEKGKCPERWPVNRSKTEGRGEGGPEESRIGGNSKKEGE
jgi:hypothetical protein